MPKFRLKQLGFSHSFWGPFTNHRERTQKFREIFDLNISIKNESDKVCFTHDAGYAKINLI